MIIFKNVVVGVFLLCTPHFLFSDENTPKREFLVFSSVLSSGGSVGCPSSQSVKLINTYSELSKAFKYLIECTSQSDSDIKPPSIDLKKGSAVLLDMGAQGSLGHYISAIRMIKWDSKYYLTYATVEPGERCIAAAQMQRPYQLIYFQDKIDSLNTHHVRGYESCDRR